MILSNEEKDEIQRIVEEVPYEELLTFKNKMISEAEFIQNQLRKLWYYNNNPLANPIEANHHRDLESQLQKAQQSAKDNWDKLLRSQAEMENLKRRTTKDLENAHKFALDGFVKALLEVSDSLTMGIKSAKDEKATIETTTEGLELTMKVFNSTLEKFGVESINPVDEKFDPELHEAVTMVPMPDKKSNTVLEVIQTGFTLNGRLVRPALVIVVQ